MSLPYNCEFMFFELKKAFSCSPDTSPGSDGITYNILRHLQTESLSNLLYLFNRIWTEQKFPSQCQEAILLPTLKPVKDAADPLNFRPIALTSCMCKTLARMVNIRLVSRFRETRMLPLQSGFRRGRSTNDNIVLLETQI
ncbi:hypothetical protein AVEN_158368-1 [Araneus ventricosus]|uniref:Reverse transcriptase domain-containing protein n=1 Tax=Araneus ventricosus TaxID=182803 RepID=A0A4Y2RPD6_ARAVE|nr:hypothetical protein AVEN_158368-1 [Araneus ventricosus]